MMLLLHQIQIIIRKLSVKKQNLRSWDRPEKTSPFLPFVEKDYQITISQFTLKEVIRQTIFSIAVNDSNKMMTGELFDINDGELKVVSLDGHRISIRKIELKSSYPAKKVIVPGKTLTEISKILTGGRR